MDLVDAAPASFFALLAFGLFPFATFAPAVAAVGVVVAVAGATTAGEDAIVFSIVDLVSFSDGEADAATFAAHELLGFDSGCCCCCCIIC